MADSIRHRGPDADGFYFDGPVALGHRRLSIIDLEGGKQPMSSPDGTHCIVFNGEIYNYRELAKQLSATSVAFQTSSDTEVLLNAYVEYGVHAIDMLNGMFAFAIWDKSQQELVISRDRFGEKPLYYWHDNRGTLVFASELKALIAHPKVPTDVCMDALGEYLAVGYIGADRCVYKGIKKLPAGHTLKFNANGLSISSYWNPASFQLDPKANASDWYDELDALIRDSVRLRLRSDVPVGTFLSGGVDSSLISYYASQEYGGRLKTFTVKFDDSDADESEYSRAVAKQLGTDHQEIQLEDFGIAELSKLIDQFDEPLADPSSLATFFLTREASRQMKVCLSGDAGDELLGGYSRYLPEAFEPAIQMLPPTIRSTLLGQLGKLWPDGAPGKGWLNRMSLPEVERFLGRIWLFAPDEVPRLTGNDSELTRATQKAIESLSAVASKFAHTRQDWQLILDQTTYLTDDILVKVDRTSMLNSLEVRVPLLDHRICELVNSKPLNQKVVNGELKHPLKQLARKVFPSALVDRKKHGFGLPLNQWFKSGPLDDAFRQMVLSNGSKVSAYMDMPYLSKLYDSHQKGYRDLGTKMWSVYWLEMWLRSAG